MIDHEQNFQPDWVSPPGDTIRDMMQERDWSQVQLSGRLGLSAKHTNRLIMGKVPLTDDIAFRLERVLGGSLNFWLNREVNFREQLARLDSKRRYESWVGWLDELPLKDLKSAGVIPQERITKAIKPRLVEILLSFFGVASPDEWQTNYGVLQASFRRTRQCQSEVGAIASWLRLGEVAAEKMHTPKYHRARFEKTMREIRELTVLPPREFGPELRRLCSEAGVKLVLVPAIPRAHVSGVARWLNRHSPLIQLSLYGKTNDKFWFTLFHEAAHILFHADNKQAIFLDDANQAMEDSKQELEADHWAGDQLIPSLHHSALSRLHGEAELLAFARELNVHPGIVVGRLQHDGLLGYATSLNQLKERFQFTEA